MKNSHSESYAAAGVDVTAGYEAVERIKPMVESTYIPGVMGTLGGFGGMFAPDLAGMKKPVLVSGTDGVGTKLKLAFLMDKHDTVGIDCVAMCVNDIVCGGAAPMFFLDYIACGKNHPARIADIVSGITEGCRQAECALVGGETAEMTGFYPVDEYDLAGFSVGIVDEEKIIDGKKLAAGDVLVGLASSGVHSNGFSLVRKVLDVEHADLKTPREDLNGKSLGEALLAPTRIYVKAVKALLKAGVDVHAVSHKVCADLVQVGLVGLCVGVVIGVVKGDALLLADGVQTALHRFHDLVKGGVVHIVDDAHLESLASGGSTAGSRCGGGDCCTGGGAGSSAAAAGQCHGRNSGSGQSGLQEAAAGDHVQVFHSGNSFPGAGGKSKDPLPLRDGS